MSRSSVRLRWVARFFVVKDTGNILAIDPVAGQSNTATGFFSDYIALKPILPPADLFILEPVKGGNCFDFVEFSP